MISAGCVISREIQWYCTHACMQQPSINLASDDRKLIIMPAVFWYYAGIIHHCHYDYHREFTMCVLVLRLGRVHPGAWARLVGSIHV